MYIEQAYTKNYSFLSYLPITLMFFFLILLNFVALKVTNIDSEQVIQQQIEQSGEMTVFFLAVMPLAFFLIMLLVWVKVFQRQTITSLTTSRSSISWRRIFFSFGLWAALNIVLTGISYIMYPENFVLNFKLIPFLILFAIAVVLIPMQTSFEEYLFRAHLMQGLGIATRSRLFPLLFTSITFGVMHIANPEVGKMGYILLVYYIGTGLFLGIVTLMDDGLELALGFHAANNLITCLLVTSDWTALQTPSVLKDISEPSAGFDVLVPVLIFYPLLLLIFAKKYKWHGWQQKLTAKIELPQLES
ncbi:CPBP family intramembrane metalloprotease [Flavobacterium sp. Sd200]|uniref:CPBP family intramembrane glutamic endopeptidase n=1 Tax=Flavobacterium sp. Sd200 TaxID=2692211 RepID=UPI001369EA13|nr:CPBP family intramembrane glutamic endopeptidase [Flavobacterium sp. Sd200]MXN90253.1 CPBP family intramembrane metalloprotease [Flavobacterium sp. Sd200]